MQSFDQRSLVQFIFIILSNRIIILIYLCNESINSEPQYFRNQPLQSSIRGKQKICGKKMAEDPSYFKTLSKGQNPKYLLIGCSDSRAPPNELTETDPGEIFIHRNIANLVIPTDLNVRVSLILKAQLCYSICSRAFTYSQYCGDGTYLLWWCKGSYDLRFRRGLLDLWLNQIKLVYEKHAELIESFADENDKITCLSQLNVRAQVMNIWKNPIIQKAWQKGNPVMVHGWLFRVETGYIEELLIDQHTPEEMCKVYALKFKLESEKQLSKHVSPTGSPKNNAKRFQNMQRKLIEHINQLKENKIEDFDLETKEIGGFIESSKDL